MKKYNTRNPFELADFLNTTVIFYPIKSGVRGFYDKVLRHKFIIINSSLPEHIQRQVCAHELGHALLHKGWGYYFMIEEHTFFSPGCFEREANEFTWQLLFDEEACRVEYDLGRYVREEGIVELVGYRKKYTALSTNGDAVYFLNHLLLVVINFTWLIHIFYSH